MPTPTSDPVVDLIEQLSQLSSRLSSSDFPEARKEALQLSKQITMSLEQPEDVAVASAFSVCSNSLASPRRSS